MRAVLVPVKRFSEANERLCGVLSPEERQGLARVMLEDVLSNVSLCRLADAVFVVTAEPEAMSMARLMGMGVITEEIQTGESDSVDFAMKKCSDMGMDCALVVPGDIPLARFEEFDEVMETDDLKNRVVAVPSRDGTGTNALMMRPCGIIKCSFGEHSFPRHRDMALQTGVEFSCLKLDGIGLDIDAPQDMEIFMKGGGTRTHVYLNSIGTETKKGKTALHGF